MIRKTQKHIYLDYAATTPVDPRVFRAMEPYFSEHFGNPGTLHVFGQNASRAVYEARSKIAEILGVKNQEICFTGSATEANNMALRGAIAEFRRRDAEFRGKGLVTEKPRIIISAIEHESILETAKDLEQEGVEVVVIPVSREGVIDIEKLKKALNEHTVLVSVMYANNEIGTIQPIAEIAEIIQNYKHSKNVSKLEIKNLKLGVEYPLFHTDAVQALQYLDVFVNEIGVDFMTLSAHKIYGPKGIGALYVRNNEVGIKKYGKADKNPIIPNSQFTIQPMVTGGGQEFGLRSGTENVPGIVGFGKAVELIQQSRFKEEKRIYELRNYFWSMLKKQGLRIGLNGPQLLKRKSRLSNNLNIRFFGMRADELLISLDLQGISASAGPACSERSSKPSQTLHAIGLREDEARESIRFTLGKYTTRQNIDRVVRVIKNSIAKLS